MSKGNEQALISLAAITGCLVTMVNKNCFALVTMKTKTKQTLDQSIVVGKIWFKDYEDRSTSDQRMIETFAPWNQWMEKNVDELTCEILASAGFRLASDLEEKLKNPRKKRLVGELKDELELIEDYASSGGTRFDSIEQGNIIIDKLQELAGWEDTNFVKPPKE